MGKNKGKFQNKEIKQNVLKTSCECEQFCKHFCNDYYKYLQLLSQGKAGKGIICRAKT